MCIIIEKLLGSWSFGESFHSRKDFPGQEVVNILGNFSFGRHWDVMGETMADCYPMYHNLLYGLRTACVFNEASWWKVQHIICTTWYASGIYIYIRAYVRQIDLKQSSPYNNERGAGICY